MTYDGRDYPEAATQAERFVDDTTMLRMLRLRMPMAKPEISGVTSDTIKTIHLAGVVREDWNTPLTDIAFRFPDGSVAYRLRTGRWEAYRTW